MGLDNKVTAERYQTIQRYIEERDLSVKDDIAVGKIFGVSKTVVQAIRNTRDYEAYQQRIKSHHKASKRKRPKNSRQVILPSSGLPLEELPINKNGIDSTAAMLGGIGAVILLFLIMLSIVVIWIVFKEFYGIG